MKTYICEQPERIKPFLQAHPKGHFMQLPEWAQVKSEWKHRTIVVEDDTGNTKGYMSVLIRRVPGLPFTMMYAPRGPVCDPHDRETLKALLEEAKKLAKKHRSYVLRLDPDIEAEDMEFAKIVQELGFRVKAASKNFEGIQPRFVFRLDVAGKSEEEVMQVFHQKWRYNIRLAQKKGVTVRLGNREDIGEFHRIMLETGVRDSFVIRSREYFERMYDSLAPEYMRLYLAEFEGKIVAGTLPLLFGNKCWYLYGASSNQYRNVMPNYLLQWEMIKWSLEQGCDLYDFRGVSGDLDESNPLYGLYKFKKGFGGKFTEFIGELDYIFNPVAYLLVEKGLRLYRNARKKLFTRKHKKEENHEKTAGGEE